MKLISLLKSLKRRNLWLRWAGIIAVIAIPLAFTGLFIGSLSHSDKAVGRIPAAVVNSDKLIYTTDAEGNQSPVFAGRQLVTELTSGESVFDWQVTNAEDAKEDLRSGKVYAVLTIPQDFSKSILSLSGTDPERGMISIKTDDAHSYLSSTLAQTVGHSLADTFGTEVTAKYIEQVQAGIGELGNSLGTAADGAKSLSTGAQNLSAGLGELAGGVNSAKQGAKDLSDGISAYTNGVDSLSAGLSQLNSGAGNLTALSNGVSQFTGSVSALANALAAANSNLQANPNDPVALATVNQLSAQLSAAASGGAQLSSQVSAGLGGISTGISQSATGANQLASGSAALRNGSNSLVSGLSDLGAGAAASASGADQLASGASDLATGLAAGAAQIPGEATDPTGSANVVANPVGVQMQRENALTGIGQSIAGFMVPLGLWIGALAIFLVSKPLERRELGTGAGNFRLVIRTFLRTAKFSLLQALALVLLLHTAVGVGWAALPATLGFAILLALAFTAFHLLLVIGFGKGGLVVSLLALAIQVTATGGLYPVELLSKPFQWLSQLMPLSYGVSGMQSIIASANPSGVFGSVAILLLFGLASLAVAIPVIGRVRRIRSLQVLATRTS